MKKLISLSLCLLLLFATFAPAFAAEVAELHTVSISGVYRQKQARTLLKKVNDFRLNKVKSSDPNHYDGYEAWAWAWDAKNLRFYKESYPNLQAFTYDYEQEEIAMQRASEIAVYYGNDHTRPNNTSWRTAHTTYNPANGISIGENIFATTNCDVMESVNLAFEWWLEKDDPYEGQSHRRNILGCEYPFVSTAFACFEVNEVFYWVELFRSVNVNPTATTVGTDTVTKKVVLSSDFVKSIAYTPVSEAIHLNLGESTKILPIGNLITTNHILTYQETSSGKYVQVPTVIDVEAPLKSSNTSVATVAGATVKAVSAGTATITATAYGKSITYVVIVSKTNIASAFINFKDDIETYIYTGNPITPQIASVTLGTSKLNTSDYSVSFTDNVKIGTALVTLTGKGNYEGTLTKSFEIIDKASCTHQMVFDPAIEGNCMVKGKTAGSHCKICGYVATAQKETGFGTHKEYVPAGCEAKDPTCTEDGRTKTVMCSICGKFLVEGTTIPKLGHTFPDVTDTTKATISTDGKQTRECSRCGTVEVIKVISRPKTFTLSKTKFTYNGKVQKPKLTIKDTNGNIIAASNYTAKIPSGKKVGKYKIVVTFKGTQYSGTKELTYEIIPKNTSSFSVSAAKKAFKVKWKTQKTQTTGYQIQYSLKSDFSSPKTFTLSNNKYTSATISKLTGKKKYYVRIRTYTVVKYEGKKTKIYSSWFKAKTVITKK